MDRSEIFDKIAEVAADVLGVDVAEISDETTFDDLDANSLEPGDAITFDRNDAVVTHQVYEVNADSKTVMTQGVANVDSDGSIMHDVEPVSFSQVLGTPVFCIPYLGYVNVFCTTMPGILIVALVALALIAASYATSGMRRKAAAAQ